MNKVRAHVLQDGHVDNITGPRCMIKPTEGEHQGLYLVAHTDTVLKEGQPVIFDYITRRAIPYHETTATSPSTPDMEEVSHG